MLTNRRAARNTDPAEVNDDDGAICGCPGVWEADDLHLLGVVQLHLLSHSLPILLILLGLVLEWTQGFTKVYARFQNGACTTMKYYCNRATK